MGTRSPQHHLPTPDTQHNRETKLKKGDVNLWITILSRNVRLTARNVWKKIADCTMKNTRGANSRA